MNQPSLTINEKQDKVLSKRIPEIEFIRFAAAVAIVAFHYGVLNGGFLAVDFFFILSGLLLTKSLLYSENKNNKNIFTYQWKQIKGFYPELFLAVSWYCLFIFFREGINISTTVTYILGAIDDLLLLRMTGLFEQHHGGGLITSWYLSSLVLSVSFAYLIISKIRNPFLLLFCAFIPLGYMIHRTGGLGHTSAWMAFTYNGNFRALGDLLVGGAVCHVATQLKEFTPSFTFNLLRKIIKFLCLVGICLLFVFHSHKYAPYIIVFSALYLSVVFSEGQRKQSTSFLSKTCLLLGRLSVSLFLCHDAVLSCIGGKILCHPFLIQYHLNQIFLIFTIIVCTLITAWLSNRIRTRLFRA